MAGRDVAESRAALPYPFPPALVALTLTCAPSDRGTVDKRKIYRFFYKKFANLLPASAYIMRRFLIWRRSSS